MDINVVGTVIWACITLICLICSVAAYANTVATKDDIHAIRVLLERLVSSDTHPNIAVSRDSDTQRRLERLEGAVLVLSERVKDIGNDTTTHKLLRELIDTIQTRPLFDSAPTPVQNVQYYFEQSENSRNKLSPKLLAATEWVSKNDPDGKLTVRQIAEKARVSIGTAQAAIKLLRDERNTKA